MGTPSKTSERMMESMLDAMRAAGIHADRTLRAYCPACGWEMNEGESAPDVRVHLEARVCDIVNAVRFDMERSFMPAYLDGKIVGYQIVDWVEEIVGKQVRFWMGA